MGRHIKWSSEEVILTLHKLYSEANKIPSKRKNNGLYSASRKFYGTWNNALRAAGYLVKDNQKVTLPELSPRLAYLIGLIITDGHLSHCGRRYDVRIYTSYTEERDIVLKLIKELFGYVAFVRKRKYGFNVLVNNEIIICSKDVLLLLNDLGVPIGAKSKTVELPKSMVKSDDIFFAFLRGIIDGDGSIGRRIRISSGSDLFLKQLKEALRNKVTCHFERGKTANSISINKQRDILQLYSKLYNNAEFYYKRKKERFENLLKSFIKHENTDSLSRLSSKI